MSSSKTAPSPLTLAADLNRWRAFVAIADYGSLTRAALFLNSNQSLLSRQLNALELDCNTRLFNRTGRGMVLSDVGKRVYSRVQALLHEAELLELELRGQALEPAGRVTLGSLPSITYPIVGRLFQDLRRRYPAIHLKILEGSSGQVEEWLADDRVDLAILYRYGQQQPPGERAMATVDSCLVGPAGDRLTAAGEVAFAQLDGLPFILPSAPNGLRTTLDALARRLHIALEPVIEADSLPIMRSVVAQERLYTVLPVHAVWQEVASGQLQAARIVDPPVQRTVSLAFAASKGPERAVSVVAAMIGEIVEESARLGMWSQHPNHTPRPADPPGA